MLRSQGDGRGGSSKQLLDVFEVDLNVIVSALDALYGVALIVSGLRVDVQTDGLRIRRIVPANVPDDPGDGHLPGSELHLHPGDVPAAAVELGGVGALGGSKGARARVHPVLVFDAQHIEVLQLGRAVDPVEELDGFGGGIALDVEHLKVPDLVVGELLVLTLVEAVELDAAQFGVLGVRQQGRQIVLPMFALEVMWEKAKQVARSK